MAGDIPPELLTETCGEKPGLACEKILEWTENETLAQLGSAVVDTPLHIAIILVIAWIANKVVRRVIDRTIIRATDDDARQLMRRMKRRTGADRLLVDTGPHRALRADMRAETISSVLRSIATALIWTVAGTMVLAELGINIGPLVAGAGIAGVALGFGAQSLVRDFLSGMFMLMEDQFGVGDLIDVGAAVGVVEAVSLRTTRLRGIEGTVWHVPNGEIHRVGNMSQQWARALIDIGVSYETDIDEAKRVIKAVADDFYASSKWRRLMLEEPEVWGVEDLGVDGVVIRLVIKTEPGKQFTVMRQLRGPIKTGLDQAGIRVPLSPRTVWIRRDEGSSVSHEVAVDDL